VISELEDDEPQKSKGTTYDPDSFDRLLPPVMEVAEIFIAEQEGYPAAIYLSYVINEVRFIVTSHDGTIAETYNDGKYVYRISSDGADTTVHVMLMKDTGKSHSEEMPYWFIGANTPEDMIN
jgi:hypothetical protein